MTHDPHEDPQRHEAQDPDRPGGLDPERLMAMGQGDPRGEVIYTKGTSFKPPAPAELAEAFPDLEIIGLLGQGGMGAVYKAVQKKLDRAVALKILPPQVGQDPSFAERFRREAKTLAQLNHPHVVTVHDFGEQGGYFYLLMEFVDGMNLRQMLEMGQLSAAEALNIVPQVCDALQFAHEQGIVHRDIKPENILIDQRGQVHIADFGLAKIMGRSPQDVTLTQTHHRLGTPHYMAPEQVEQPAQVDHRADIFSLGVVFYEMLTGQLPLGRFEPPSAKAHVSPAFDPVVMRSLEKEPARRYQHASEVRRQVESLDPGAAGAPAAATAAPAAESTTPAAASATPVAVVGGEPPRLSKLALFGFLWLVLGFFGGCGGYWTIATDRTASHGRAAAMARERALVLEQHARETGEVPVPQEPTPEQYAGDIQDSMAFGWYLGFLFLLCLLAGPIMSAIAIPKIRHSRGRLCGMGLAVFTTFILPLLLVNALICAPLSSVRDSDIFGVAMAFAILVLVVLDIWFLVWFTRKMSMP
ncbi:MAG: serine/threonine-protein kinase [Planctomycetota bacterium]|jgi:predicted Ser/Thr protein kinase